MKMACIREKREQLEMDMLSPLATKAAMSKGREKFEEKCNIRTDFTRDRDRIIHSKSFRRLKHKTQVFISSDNDHFRTRLTHTLEVSQIARTMSRALNLNEDLTEAIAMGHDLGHTPFGHSGERALSQLCPTGFRHYEQSLRVVDVLERDGNGMNLTFEVRDGIANHTGSDMPATQEGLVVKYADRFAYINHDIDDALRAGVIHESDLPKNEIDVLGQTHSSRINTLIEDVVEASTKSGKVCMTKPVEKAMLALRTFMFDAVYRKLAVRDYQSYMVIEKLYVYFRSNPLKLPEEYRKLLDFWDIDTVVCDYISGMTDNYCISVFNELFMPVAWDK